MTPHELESLLLRRWHEVQVALSPLLDTARLEWAFADTDMLRVPRRYASTIGDGGNVCRVQFPQKALTASFDRMDAVIRHELGHVVDIILFQPDLEGWALAHGVWLPSTPERKADALAALLWGQTIYYDNELIQTLLPGIHPRPESLGL